MSADEYADWMALYALDPWGEYRADLRQAITTNIIARAHGSKKSRPIDFMPFEKETESDPSIEDVVTFLNKVENG